MFGLFSKKTDNNAAKLKDDFNETLVQVKAAEREIQGLVGRGIQQAEQSFLKSYSITSFSAAPFAEQMKQVNFIRAMEVEINKQEGPMRVLSIGYALFNRWQGAIMARNPELIELFESELRRLKNIAESYSK